MKEKPGFEMRIVAAFSTDLFAGKPPGSGVMPPQPAPQPPHPPPLHEATRRMNKSPKRWRKRVCEPTLKAYHNRFLGISQSFSATGPPVSTRAVKSFMRSASSFGVTSRRRFGPMPSTQNEPIAAPKYIARRTVWWSTSPTRAM